MNLLFFFFTTLKQNGTILHRYCPHAFEQNGHTERKPRHVLDMVRLLLLSTSIPEHFLGEASLIVVYIINWVPSPTILNKFPYDSS